MPANARKEMFDSVVPGMLASLLGDVAAAPSQGLALITSRLYNYEARVYKPRAVPLVYSRLVPVDTSDGEGAAGRAYMILDERGDTKEIARGSDDMPLVDLGGTDRYLLFKTGGVGYTYDTEDLRQASLLNFQRVAQLPQVAFNIYERAINEHALFGNTRGGKLGFKEGLFTSTTVPRFTSTVTISDAMTVDDMLNVFNAAIDAVNTNSNNTSNANVLAVPQKLMTLAGRTPLNGNTTDTVLTYFKATNKTTQETGQPITIIGVKGLETAGVGGKPRVMAYERLDENLVLPLPMPLKFMTPQVRNLTFVVPGEYKYGPVHFRYPNSAVYEDLAGITFSAEDQRTENALKGDSSKGELTAGKEQQPIGDQKHEDREKASKKFS